MSVGILDDKLGSASVMTYKLILLTPYTNVNVCFTNVKYYASVFFDPDSLGGPAKKVYLREKQEASRFNRMNFL